MDFPRDTAHGIGDTRDFDREHSGHPMHSTVHTKRIQASRFFWQLSEGDPSAIPDSVLPDLHRSLFDASAAVRYDIAMCLGQLRRPASAAHLQRLIDTEPDSQNVRDVARWALEGDRQCRYGAPITDTTAQLALRDPADSEITRDRRHGPLLGVRNMFYVLWAAYAWELRHDLANDTVRANLSTLSSPTFTFRGASGEEPQTLHTSLQRVVYAHIEQAIKDYAQRPLTAADANQRITETLTMFKMVGYYDYFAGHEGDIRIRLLALLDAAGVKHTSAAPLTGEAKQLAAYYLAYTDCYFKDLPADLDRDELTDVRVFMSHSSTDKDHARRLADTLQATGIKVWLDERELTVGDSLWDEIGHGIDESDYLILLISPRSVASSWVKRELNAGLATELTDGKKRVLPVVVEPTDIPVFLRERLYCDLGADFELGVAALIRALGHETSPGGRGSYPADGS